MLPEPLSTRGFSKLLSSQLRTFAGFDFLNDCARDGYFREHLAGNLQVSGGCQSESRTGVDYQVTWDPAWRTTCANCVTW